MMTATDIHYGPAGRVCGLNAGWIGAILLLARDVDVITEIGRNLHLLKWHLPYHESDHVLYIALNILAGGQWIEHLELRRNDEVYLNPLGAERIPDPTTAGEFCRRFCPADVLTLMEIHAYIRATPPHTALTSVVWCRSGRTDTVAGSWIEVTSDRVPAESAPTSIGDVGSVFALVDRVPDSAASVSFVGIWEIPVISFASDRRES
jgi:hypothetical protein